MESSCHWCNGLMHLNLMSISLMNWAHCKNSTVFFLIVWNEVLLVSYLFSLPLLSNLFYLTTGKNIVSFCVSAWLVYLIWTCTSIELIFLQAIQVWSMCTGLYFGFTFHHTTKKTMVIIIFTLFIHCTSWDSVA